MGGSNITLISQKPSRTCMKEASCLELLISHWPWTAPYQGRPWTDPCQSWLWTSYLRIDSLLFPRSFLKESTPNPWFEKSNFTEFEICKKHKNSELSTMSYLRYHQDHLASV